MGINALIICGIILFAAFMVAPAFAGRGGSSRKMRQIRFGEKAHFMQQEQSQQQLRDSSNATESEEDVPFAVNE